jgi:hypothetical protein
LTRREFIHGIKIGVENEIQDKSANNLIIVQVVSGVKVA